MAIVRPYRPADYEAVKALYLKGDMYGGQFDPDRDSAERMEKQVVQDPEGILVYENEGQITGTVTLLENPRTAWLFRFAAAEQSIAQSLYREAARILASRGHKQLLVYGDETMKQKYDALEMHQGNSYICYWSEITS